MRHIIPISGKDSCATAIVQTTLEPDLEYELFFTDVGCELPETYEWLEKVENKLNQKIIRVGESLEKIIYKKGILPGPKTRFCTRLSKIEPMEQFIGGDEATIYFGIRSDEDRWGYDNNKKPNIIAKYPLKELGIGLQQVYAILDKKDLRPPCFFWQWMYDSVKQKLNRSYQGGFGFSKSADDFLSTLPQWIFDRLFAWRTRSNCIQCFFQKSYEWVGLLEHHPNLFQWAEEMEDKVGNNEQEKPYTFYREGISLGWIRDHKEEIKEKRSDKIVKTLQTKRIELDIPDELSVISCGLFCGK